MPNNTMTRVWKDLDEVVEANVNIGQFFFSQKAMDEANTFIHTGVLKGHFFITSDESYSNPKLTRKYTIRQIDDMGRVSTLGEFRGYGTIREAAASLGVTLDDIVEGLEF